jgi:membrane protease YdiL (CAAX protease family)
MKFGARDDHIRKFVGSWSSTTRLVLFLVAISSFLIETVLYLVILHVDINPMTNIWVRRISNLIDFNWQYGGFIVFLFIVFWKKSKLAYPILASLGLKKSRLNKFTVVIRNPVLFNSAMFIFLVIVYGIFFQSKYFLLGKTFLLFDSRYINWHDYLITACLVPISEEIYNRFLILYITDSWFGRAISIIFTIAFFSNHYYDLLGTTYIALLSVILTLLIVKSGSLWPVIYIHSFYNAISYFSRPI